MDMKKASEEFVDRTEPFRRELLAHCYRMLGSVDDAEDLVQETYLRAWRSYDSFEGRSSARSWLYAIATNACLNALEQRSRRVLPAVLVGPALDPDAPYGTAEPGVMWLQPIPDTLVSLQSDDPAMIAATHGSLRLALIASLQYLPPRQRVVFLLREVLEFAAAEVAAMLDTSTEAVKSTLQRARGNLQKTNLATDRLVEPTEARAQELLKQYITAFEKSDLGLLEKALRFDASIELVGTRTWFSGRTTCLRYLSHVIGSPGDWIMLPTIANGQPAVATYHNDGTGNYVALGAAILTIDAEGITRITVFAGGSDQVSKFGFSPSQSSS